MKHHLFLLLALGTALPLVSIQAQSGYSTSKNTALEWPRFKRGVKSPQVKVLQQLLNARGAKLVVDSRYGASTEGAVKRFQKSKRIQVDGIVGAQTWEELVIPVKRGSRGTGVRIFQGLLSHQGYKVAQDGVFGAATERAVRRFQKERGDETYGADGQGSARVWCLLLEGYDGPEYGD